MRTLLIALLTLTRGVAMAQEEEPPAPTASPEEELVTGLDERLTSTEEQVSAIEEQLIELKNDLSPLKRLEFSGFVQARYAYLETPAEGEGGSSAFLVSRARLTSTYTGELGQLELQLDAVPTGVTLLDAMATLFIPGTRQKMALTLGQMKWPFSYEVLQSSADREFPERSRVVRAFLRDVRDTGLRYSYELGPFRVMAGLFNGAGINTLDTDKEKDLVGRVSFDLKLLSGGVSAWYGTTLRPGAVVDGTSVSAEAFPRTRLGVDLQVYLDVLPFGTTALKGELITGQSYYTDEAEAYGVQARGWYVLLVQSFGLNNAVAVRYDSFDPDAGDPTRPAATHPVGTLGVAAIHSFSEHLKATLAYELPMTETVASGMDPQDNLLTLQLQARY